MDKTEVMKHTIYGREAIREWLIDTTKAEQVNDAYRMKNVLFILEKDCVNIRVYTDDYQSACLTSLLLDYDDFAIQYWEGWQNLTILSRDGDTVDTIDPEMYISIKGVLA